MRYTGAQIIIHLLERQGIRLIPGIPGGANLPLYDALGQSRRIRHILARHEQGAAFMAQGMARATGRPAICFATSGPGATNTLTAIADAWLDSIPIICITGQVPTSLLGTMAFQEVNTCDICASFTKGAFMAKSAAELLTLIPMAFRLAASGRPGPVLIDVPKDVQLQSIDVAAWPEPGEPEPLPELDPTAIARAAAMIDAAARPILYLGGGAIASGAGELATRLAEMCSLPTTMTLMGLGAMPMDHPLSLGMLGMHGARYTNLALQECDLLIAAGSRFDDRAIGQANAFCPDADIIHIDIDPGEINKIRRAHVGISGDLGQVIEALLPRLHPRPRRAWLQRIARLKAAHPLLLPGGDDPRTPCGLIRRVAEGVGDEAIIATDVGQHQMWTAQTYPFRRSRQWLTSGGLGTMGFGLPAAIGAALAFPERQVVCFTGDGSLLMNLQELITAVEENCNLKIVLMNNRSLGLVHQQQELFYENRLFASDFQHTPDFCALARACGMESHDLGGAANPEAVLDYALGSSGPCLIHAPIEVMEKVYPMVPPGAPNHQMIGGELAIVESLVLE